MTEYLVGVDLGGTNLRCAVVDSECGILSRSEQVTAVNDGPDAVTAQIVKGVQQAIADADLDTGRIAGIGIGAPGPLDGCAGIVIQAPNMPGWENFPISSKVTEGTSLPVFLENDANAAGWGEYWAGAGRGCDSMIMMTLGTGIGGAVIINGKLIHGPDWTAGEIGHICIIDGGRACGCGSRGCIEAYASATATVSRFREALDFGWESDLRGSKGTPITCEDIFDAARAGDNLARHIVNETGRYLGLMAANMVNLLNPERCVFSGGMINAGELLFDAIRAECDARAFPLPGKRLQILPAELGADAGLIGAAGCAMKALQEKYD